MRRPFSGLSAASTSEFSSAGKCSFAKRPPVVLKDSQVEGFCKFDHATQLFGGTPAEQARCLLNPVEPVGRLGAAMDLLPEALEKRVGGEIDLPSRDALAGLLRDRGATQDLIDTLAQPVSHAHDNDPLARSATYIVFHDTSTPNYRTQPWPLSIDEDPKINNLARYECSNDIERAHVFINRSGKIFLAHDFTVPWRATKFEAAKNFGPALKGLFLHIELIQPRRALKGYGSRNDFLAPSPGFSQAQYEFAGAGLHGGEPPCRLLDDSGLPLGARRGHPQQARRPAEFRTGTVRAKPRCAGRRVADPDRGGGRKSGRAEARLILRPPAGRSRPL